MFGDIFEQVGRLAPHVRVTRRLNKESRQPNGERSKATRVIRLMKKGEVDCDGKHWAHVYKQLRGNLKAEAMRSCLGQLTSSSLNLSTLANCADAQKIRNILKLGGKGRPCHYCAGDPDSRAAFLAKIWQTMGTPAINAEASQNRRRPAPQAIFFLEGASASESDFAWILTGVFIILYLQKKNAFEGHMFDIWIIIVATWWKVGWTSAIPKKTFILFNKF